ncbi:MAG TPA: hypothetical protein VN151_14435 [Terracidiphilus sp.]|nr:hypothetical protein [Terracidiphilus sp.]
MKRKMLLALMAAVPAVLLPLASHSQIKLEKPPTATNEPVYKYEVFAGWGYTSINQVSQSNSGLQGVSASVTRDFGKYFGVTAEGGHYAWTVTRSNSDKVTVDHFLAGPVLHAPLYGPTSIFIHGLLGTVHTGDISISPNYSFAGGIGLGMDYALNPRWGLRLYGDDIGSSFSVTPYTSGDSPHRRFNAHAGFGVTYKF